MNGFKKKVKRIGRFFKNLLFPPRCVACKEFIQKDMLDECEAPFCEKCRLKWELEKLSKCPDCGLEMTVCNCSAPLLKKSGVEEYVKLINYSVRKKSVGKSAILHLKRTKNARAFDFFAGQLSYSARIKNNVSNKADTLITYVPRSKRSKIKYGFDQSETLANKLAQKIDSRMVGLFCRVGKQKTEQKKLGIKERRENALNMFSVKKSVFKRLNDVKCVVIVDDIITSGASLLGCVTALKKYYDGKIICVSMARTGKNR